MASSGRAFFKPAHASDTRFATVPGLVPRCPAIIRFAHPLNPQASDSTSYPRHSPITARQRSALHPCQGGGPGARRAPRPRLLSAWLAAPASDARAYRSLCGRLPRTSRRHPGRRLRLRAGPQARPQNGEDLPTGRLGDIDGDDADIRCGLVVKLHGGVFGCCRVAQVTTTHTGPDSGSRRTSPACRSRSGWCQVPDLTREVALPWSGQASHPAPAVPVRPRRSLSGHHVPSSGQASIRQAGRPRNLHRGFQHPGGV